jgi:hypothetical protein
VDDAGRRKSAMMFDRNDMVMMWVLGCITGVLFCITALLMTGEL